MTKWLNSPALDYDPLRYQVETERTLHPERFARMVEWCRANLPQTDWSGCQSAYTSYRRVHGAQFCSRFCFRQEAQRVMFVLAWSGDPNP